MRIVPLIACLHTLALCPLLKAETPTAMDLNWEPLYPAGSITATNTDPEVRGENGFITNVQVPVMAQFRSNVGTAPRPAVVICPGGGYAILAIEHEGYDIARWFNALGFDAYVLKYRLKEFGYPAPLQDVTRAVRILRSQAQERGIRPDQIGILGFSAGGHVAGMATTLYDSPDSHFGDALDATSARPDFSMLIYAVLSMEEGVGHMGSRLNLLGPEATPEQVQALSLYKRVTEHTPPVFLFHTASDAAVPVENSLRMASALARHKVPFALHVYETAPHGIGMRSGHGPASGWPRLLEEWLKSDRGLAGE